MGVTYARSNYKTRLDAYPDFQSPYYDCTNFVSQCLLAGGALHQYEDWYIERINTDYHTVTNNTQLDYSWRLSDPSPWISAKEFKSKFYSSKSIHYCTGAYVINKAGEIWGLNIYKGDVIQVADNIIGFPGKATHTMYVTGSSERYINGELYASYEVTYHSSDKKDVNLIDLVSTVNGAGETYLENIIVFYDFT